EDRPPWQLVLAGLLAGALIMIRQNMVIVLPILVLYIWWQHGGKTALYAAAAGGAVLIFFHALYWPYILQLWTPWMPERVQALFARYGLQLSGTPVWDPSIDLSGRLLSFFQGVRFNFIAMAGLLIGLILLPDRGTLSRSGFRAAVFLAVLFTALLLMHSWAAISNDYCVFCFTPYLAFFNVSAVLFLAAILPGLSRGAGGLRQTLLIAGVLILFAGTGYSAFEDLGDGLLAMNVPRVRDGRIVGGLTTLWELMSNKFPMDRNTGEKIAALGVGLASGLVLLLAALWIYKAWRGDRGNYAHVLALTVLAFGLIFAPVLAGSAGRPDCPGMDVIRANEQVGAYVAENIPPGSRVFWNGGLSVAPLLYAPGVHIYLPQINDGYAHRLGGDADQLLKYGFWNDELSAQWMKEADFVVVEGWRYADMKEALPASSFDELPRSPVQTSCIKGSGLRIFRRK
ncbi:MAG: hypothetical protein ACM3QS_03015, partial [Bacteroidota bacterium]